MFIQELINCVFPCQYGQICGNSSVARLKLSSQMMKTPPKTTESNNAKFWKFCDPLDKNDDFAFDAP